MTDSSAIGTFINTAVQAGGGLINGIANRAFQDKWNNRLLQAQERENNIIRLREDTAFERAVADAQRAGLSPLAVSDGAQTAVTVSPMTGTMPLQSALGDGLQGLNNALDYNLNAQQNAISQQQVNNQRDYQDKMAELEANAQTLEDRRFYANLEQEASNLEKSLKNAKDINEANNAVAEHIAKARIKADYNLQTNDQIFQDEQARKRYKETLETVRREYAEKGYLQDKDLDFNRRKLVSDAFNGIVNTLVRSVGTSMIGHR